MCFECGEVDGLLHCYTCRRSYHGRCLDSSASHFIHDDHFFCKVCIGRKWHREIPPFSPPPPERTRVALPGHRLASARNATVRDPSPPTTTVVNRQTTAPLIATSTVETGSSGFRPSRSRYSSTSSGVDAAVSVILRELESSRETKLQVERLEELVDSLQRDVKINENARMLNLQILSEHSTVAENERKLTAEIEGLKKEVSRLGHLLDEEKSQSEKCRIEADSWMTKATGWMEQARSNQAELAELRGRLRNLLGV